MTKRLTWVSSINNMIERKKKQFKTTTLQTNETTPLLTKPSVQPPSEPTEIHEMISHSAKPPVDTSSGGGGLHNTISQPIETSIKDLSKKKKLQFSATTLQTNEATPLPTKPSVQPPSEPTEIHEMITHDDASHPQHTIPSDRVARTFATHERGVEMNSDRSTASGEKDKSSKLNMYILLAGVGALMAISLLLKKKK